MTRDPCNIAASWIRLIMKSRKHLDTYHGVVDFSFSLFLGKRGFFCRDTRKDSQVQIPPKMYSTQSRHGPTVEGVLLSRQNSMQLSLWNVGDLSRCKRGGKEATSIKFARQWLDNERHNFFSDPPPTKPIDTPVSRAWIDKPS